MKDAYDGKALYVEWTNLVEVAVEAGFSHSNGERLVHISDSIGPWHPSSHDLITMVYYFNPLNPFSERFDEILMVRFMAIAFLYQVEYNTSSLSLSLSLSLSKDGF